MKPIKFLDYRYAISENNEIYSLIGPEGIREVPVKIKPRLEDGYLKYTFKLDSGKPLNTSVHRVLAFFYNQKEDFKDKLRVVNHLDGNKLNNTPDNLSICTPKENSQHAAKLGKYNKKRQFTEEEKRGFDQK